MARLGSVIKMNGKSDIPARYDELSTDRSIYLTQAQDFSRMTLPYLLPVSTTRGTAANQHGFQSHGAQVVNHLSNKLVLTLFPPQRSFFGLDLKEEAAKMLEGAGVGKMDLAEQNASIVKKAEKVQAKLGTRVGLIEGFKHLPVSGNVCLHLPKKGNLQAIPFDRYVVKREMGGELLELILFAEKTLGSFDTATRAKIVAAKGGKNRKPNEKVKVYTRAVKQNDGFWLIDQSAEEIPIGKKSRLKDRKLPWIVLRWNTAYGEDYGRGLVEDQAGHFYLMEFLSEALAKGMVLMADVKYLVKPGSITSPQELTQTPTGEFLSGNIDDIGVLQLEKYADFKPIAEVLNATKRAIGQAFMMNSMNRRDAERVTTYELRLDAAEMETSLGGAYSLFAQTLQPDLAMLILDRVDPRLGDIVEPDILTGLDALGRVGDLDKIMQFSELMTVPQNWPQDLQARMKWAEYASTAATSLSMETPWLMDEEEFATASAAGRQSEQEDVALAEASKAIPGVIENQVQER